MCIGALYLLSLETGYYGGRYLHSVRTASKRIFCQDAQRWQALLPVAGETHLPRHCRNIAGVRACLYSW